MAIELESINKVCMFDTETVSISPNYIISLAYRYYERGKPFQNGIIECNPDYPIDPKASEVNGYTNDSVSNFPLFKDQWEKIEPFFRDSLWVGHNIPFDIRALKLELYRYSLPEPHHYWIDTLSIAKSIIPKSEIKNYKLKTLCDYFNIKSADSENFHSADFDIWATDKVFRKLKLKEKEFDLSFSFFVPKEVLGDYSENPPKKGSNK